MTEEITIICPVFAAPGKAEVLKQRMLELADATRKESGNICYKLHRADAEKFMIYEKWRNQAALDFHMATPHLRRFLADEEHLLKQEIVGTICREF